jgi:DNA-binding transcriptional ArsR family regulator
MEAEQMAKQNALRQERRSPAPSISEVAPAKLDRLIHERLRLGILSALAANESLTFIELKKLLKTTDGNLSVHARKLEDAHYITCTKSFEGRLPKTEYRLSAAGRRALERYLDHMEALIQAMRER